MKTSKLLFASALCALSLNVFAAYPNQTLTVQIPSYMVQPFELTVTYMDGTASKPVCTATACTISLKWKDQQGQRLSFTAHGPSSAYTNQIACTFRNGPDDSNVSVSSSAAAGNLSGCGFTGTTPRHDVANVSIKVW